MQNYKQRGDVLTLPAPYAVASGAGAKVGQFFGVASGAYASGAFGEFLTVGVVELKKVTAQAWTVADAFLRRVMKQRLREQEAQLLSSPAAAFRLPRCAVCAVALQRMKGDERRTLCRKCERAAKRRG